MCIPLRTSDRFIGIHLPLFMTPSNFKFISFSKLMPAGDVIAKNLGGRNILSSFFITMGGRYTTTSGWLSTLST